MRFFGLSLILMMASGLHGVKANDEIFNLIQEGKCEVILSNQDLFDSLINNKQDATLNVVTRMVYEGVCFTQNKKKAIDLYEFQLTELPHTFHDAEALVFVGGHYLGQQDQNKQKEGKRLLEIAAFKALMAVFSKNSRPSNHDNAVRFSVTNEQYRLEIYHPFFGKPVLPNYYQELIARKKLFEEKDPFKIFEIAKTLMWSESSTTYDKLIGYLLMEHADKNLTFENSDEVFLMLSIKEEQIKFFANAEVRYDLIKQNFLSSKEISDYFDNLFFKYTTYQFRNEQFLVSMLKAGVELEKSLFYDEQTPMRVFGYLVGLKSFGLLKDVDHYNNTLNQLVLYDEEMLRLSFPGEDLSPIEK